MYTVKKFIPCRVCPNRTKGGPKPGYYYETEDNYQVIKECDCHKKWREEGELERKFDFAQVNTSYTFDDYRGTESKEALEDLIYTAKNFSNKFRYQTMIYLYGPNGTQKTSMAQCLGKELIKQGLSVQYTLLNTLMISLTDIRMEEGDESSRNFVQRCQEVDLLIIDESFDSSKVTIFKSGYQIPYLDSFLRTRFEMNKKSILFISNKKPSEIASQGFGTSIENFIKRNTLTSLLEFKDVYFDAVGTPNPRELFKR